MAGRKKKPVRKRVKSAAKTAGQPGLVEQPHGGKLLTGGVPGNKGGTGRPRSVVRDQLLEAFAASSMQLLTEVIAGKPMSKARWPLAAVAPHLKCTDCGGKRLGPDAETTDVAVLAELMMIEIEVEVSASVKDRLSAIDTQAKYGLGQIREITADSVREKLNKTLDKLQERCTPELYLLLMNDLKPIWMN